MFQENQTFKQPCEKNPKIWRYMDFTKFMDLLISKSLFFTKAECFDDKFEGSITLLTANNRLKAMQTIYKDLEENHPEISFKPNYNEDPFTVFLPMLRQQVCINCWHMNEYESAAMWRLYLKSNEGIAIQSTYENLINSFSDTEIVVNIGKVEYIDFDEDIIEVGNLIAPFVHKRKSFKHEKELRAVVWTVGSGNEGKCKIENGGLKIKIDINKLIEKIYVSPDSPSWLTDLMHKIVVDEFKLDIEVKNSGLNGNPLY